MPNQYEDSCQNGDELLQYPRTMELFVISFLALDYIFIYFYSILIKKFIYLYNINTFSFIYFPIITILINIL